MRQVSIAFCLFVLMGCTKEVQYPYVGTYQGTMHRVSYHYTGSKTRDTLYQNAGFRVKQGSEAYTYMILKTAPDSILFDNMHFTILGSHFSYSGGYIRSPEIAKLTGMFAGDSMTVVSTYRMGPGFAADTVRIKAKRVP